ncbi:MAG: hypothetical protein D6683_12595, partial [Actinomyces sp.]
MLAQLKDFQRATAEWAFERLYGATDPTRRFLVADEVGLGKTMVAKAVIALTLDHLAEQGDKRTDVVYICSNRSIAKQNVNKLGDLPGGVHVIDNSRLALLPARSRYLTAGGNAGAGAVNLIALTPGTSFNLARGAGRFEERVLLHVLLRRVWPSERLDGARARRFFTHGVSERRAKHEFAPLRARFERDVTPSTGKLFSQCLRGLNAARKNRGDRSVWIEMRELIPEFRSPRRRPDPEVLQARNRLIGDLRMVLAEVGLELLQPDLVVLDEFQRFADLINPADGDDGLTALTRRLFSFDATANAERTRVLMLSATPYRMYTNGLDGGADDHYRDFVATTRFLFEGDCTDADAETAALEHDLRDLRRAAVTSDVARAKRAASEVTRRLRRVMVRTERLASTPDRNGMLTTVPMPSVDVTADDVRAYLEVAGLATQLGLGDPVELWKSAPYLVNFMENYKLRRLLEGQEGPLPAETVGHVARLQGVLKPADLDEYRAVDPANARLRSILADCVEPGHWQMLWLPPALPYYSAGGIYESDAARAFTKRLVFSSWHVVPKTVASLVSYEVERRIFEGTGTTRNDRHDGPLTLDVERGRPASMTTMALLYPCHALAALVDPAALAVDCPDAASQLEAARARLGDQVAALTRRAPRWGREDARWYAVAQVALDHTLGVRWLDRGAKEAWQTGRADEGLRAHVREISRLAAHLDEMGRPPGDLVDVLARLALAGPAVTALRGLRRVFPGSSAALDHRQGLLTAAARVAWGMRSLLNGPTAAGILRRRYPGRDYWRSVLDHGIDGNLQAVFDEYIHVLRSSTYMIGDDAGTALAMADEMADVLRLRTVDYRADVPRAGKKRLHFEPLPLRAHFAVRFGDRQHSDDQDLRRKDLTGMAFNSP